MNSICKYKAVVFDLDDTLYDYVSVHHNAMEELSFETCRRLAVTPEQFAEAFRYAREETKRTLPEQAASHNRLLYCQKCLEYLGFTPASFALDMYEVYWGSILNHMTLRENVIPVLQALKQANVILGVCTDLTAHIQHRKLKALGLQNYFQVIVSSEEAGKEKPSGDIFNMLLKKLGLKAKEVCYIGDSIEKDVIGAQHAGMHPIWFCSPEKDSKKNDIQYQKVTNFYELEKELFYDKE